MRFHSVYPIFVLTVILIFNVQLHSGIGNTYSRTPTPSDTPIPARDLDLLPVFETVSTAEYENCALPCWWGFRPGETTLHEVLIFLNDTGLDRQWKESIYASLSLEDYLRAGERFLLALEENSYLLGGNFSISFSFDEDDIINNIFLLFNNPGSWLPSEIDNVAFSNVLSTFEETPEIHIAEYQPTFRISSYRLVVIFREQGVKINYIFDLSGDNLINHPLETLRLCLDLDRTNSIEMTLSASPITDTLPDFYKTPEDAFGIGINTEEFVQFFRENPDDCLDIAEYERESE